MSWRFYIKLLRSFRFYIKTLNFNLSFTYEPNIRIIFLILCPFTKYDNHLLPTSNGRHDTQHNDTQHNDTQHKKLLCDTQHK
jgi:hypothetical protein